MSVEPVAIPPGALTPGERSQQVSKALAEAARRLRFSAQGHRGAPGGYRARRGRILSRLIVWGGFAAFVVIPTAVVGTYFAVFASDQYVSEARFAVRGGVLAGLDPITAMIGVPAARVIQDTQVVTDFIHSRAAVDALQEEVGLRSLYGRPEADWWARLGPDKPIEKALKYWERMSEVKIEMPAGLVNLSVRAFTREDALALTQAVMGLSEKLINQINDRSRRDSVSLADQELQLASARLAQARADLEVARNREGVLDAGAAATSIGSIIQTVRTQQLAMRQQLSTMMAANISRDAPQVRDLRLRIEATEHQIEQLGRELTSTDPSSSPALSASITRLSALNLQRQVAETQYAVSAAALERARLASLTKQIYITTFVQPMAAEESRYPKRLWITSLFLLGGVLAWGAFVGIATVGRKMIG